MKYRSFLLAVLIAGSVAACNERTTQATSTESAPVPADRNGCDEDNGGITLPNGFCASVFADNLGHPRHLAVTADGVVYVNTWSSKHNIMTNAPGGFIVALRDSDGDGRAEEMERFGTVYQERMPGGGTGIAIHADNLFVEVDDKIVRYPLTRESLVPARQPEIVVSGLPMDGDHTMHPFVISPGGALYVDSGSMTNSCQVRNRMMESPGQNPCTELKTRGGIWMFDARRTGQKFSPDARWATGTRNALALATHPDDNAVYAVMHGRDLLWDNWPKLYSEQQSNELPPEVFSRVEQGDDFGWPYCYFDPKQGKYVLAPEYGGDGGKAIGDCATKTMPSLAFPAHWAPEALAFTRGGSWPEKYKEGAFVSFHGSWNRSPTQAGFLIAFVPFSGGKLSGNYEEFATGFAGSSITDPMTAAHRPMGLAFGPDGALFVSDDLKGRIWRIVPMSN